MSRAVSLRSFLWSLSNRNSKTKYSLACRFIAILIQAVILKILRSILSLHQHLHPLYNWHCLRSAARTKMEIFCLLTEPKMEFGTPPLPSVP